MWSSTGRDDGLDVCCRFVELLREAGLPEAWCQPLVVTDLDVATQLVTDSRVGFFSFIGSARVGWMLRSNLAPSARCALEHGGAAPVIIAKDADMGKAQPPLANLYGRLAARMGECEENQPVSEMPLREGLAQIENDSERTDIK